MKQKLFLMLALVMTAMTASAVSGYKLTKGTLTACDIAFYIDGDLENPVTEAAEGATVIVKVIAAEENWTVSEITADDYTTYDATKTQSRRSPRSLERRSSTRRLPMRRRRSWPLFARLTVLPVTCTTIPPLPRKRGPQPVCSTSRFSVMRISSK